MRIANIHPLRLRLFMAAIACMIAGPQVAPADPTVHFELRLAPGQTDTELTLGDTEDDTLQIEVWAQVFDPPANQEVFSYGIFPRVSQGGVIINNMDFETPAFANWVSPVMDNEPASGDLSVACFDGAGVSAGIGAPALWGVFSVSAIAEGITGYGFSAGTVDPGWSLGFLDFTVLSDSDCTDGACNVTGWVDPALQSITVVSLSRSPDADEDGDVDVRDYWALQACATVEDDMTVGMRHGCSRLDLNADARIDDVDLTLFVPLMTGVMPQVGDVDGDEDVDLADFARLQYCLANVDGAGGTSRCRWVDLDRDGVLTLADLTLFVAQLEGPGE